MKASKNERVKYDISQCLIALQDELKNTTHYESIDLQNLSLDCETSNSQRYRREFFYFSANFLGLLPVSKKSMLNQISPNIIRFPKI